VKTEEFDDFYRRRVRLAYGVALRLGLRPVDAEEIAQEALLVIFNKWAALGTDEARTRYMCGVARNLTRDRVAKDLRGRQGIEALLDRVERARDTSPMASDPVLLDFWTFVRSRDLLDRRIAYLKVDLDLPERDIAKVLGIPRGTVSYRWVLLLRSFAATLQALPLLDDDAQELL
jgi:DNA-directed RNA polymerase specialized sigma24 family protein